MTWEPLSSGTYKARTYLLGLSSAAILASYYGLTVSDIPSLGVSFKDKPPELIPICLTVGIVYFLASFGIYAADDFLNQAETPFQQRLMSRYREKIEGNSEQSKKGLYDLFDSLFETDDNHQLADRLIALCHRYRDLSPDDFRENISPSIKALLDRHAPDVSGDDEQSQSVFDAVLQGLQISRQSLFILGQINPDSVSWRYSYYRKFRVWFFDIGLPIALGIGALVTMWWHLLPL